MDRAFLRRGHDARADWNYDVIGFALPACLWKLNWINHQKHLRLSSLSLCLRSVQHPFGRSRRHKILDVLGPLGAIVARAGKSAQI